MNHDVAEAITLLHDFVVGRRNHPRLKCCNSDIPNIGQRVIVETPILFGSPNLCLDWLGEQRRLQRQLGIGKLAMTPSKACCALYIASQIAQ